MEAHVGFESDKQSHLPKNGQYHDGLLPEQHGRHSLPPTTPPSYGDMGLVREEESISSCTAHPRQDKCRSGYGIQSKAGSERLDATSKGDSASNQTLHSRSLCLSPIASTEKVCQLETRPGRNPQRCVYAGLVESDCICLPTIQSHLSGTPQSQKRAGDTSVGGTTVDHTTLVAPTDRTSCGLPSISGEQSQITTGGVQSRSATPSVPRSEVSRMENIRQNYKTMGISEKAVELLCNSVKSTTTKTYNVAWSQWSGWCSERKSDPVLRPVS